MEKVVKMDRDMTKVSKHLEVYSWSIKRKYLCVLIPTLFCFTFPRVAVVR